MRNKILIYFFLILLNINSFAQKTTIKGTAIGAEGKIIRIITYADQISYMKKTIASSKIDSNGNFHLTFINPTTIFAYLYIDFYKSEIYILPGAAYEIKIRLFEKNIISKQNNPFFNPLDLDIEIINANDQGLNALIQKFNALYNNFILNNFNSVYRHHNIEKVNAFESKINKNFSSIKNKYLKNYIKYKIASIEQVAGVMSEAELAKKYFIHQSILYNHIEYMDFFNQFFKKYLFTTPSLISREDLISTVNYKKSYSSLMGILGKDSLLRNEVFRELVMLKSLNELYNTNGFNKNAVLKILSEIAVKSKFKQHRIIAKDLILTLTKLEPGTKAPDFNLKNRNNKYISLRDFKGKYVYLNFWTTWCDVCKTELDTIEKLYKKYYNRIQFVSISTDKDPEKMIDFLNKKKYQWTFLNCENNINLLEDYEVKTYPLFVLIDKDGNILQYPAKEPDEDIEAVFKSILNKGKN